MIPLQCDSPPVPLTAGVQFEVEGDRVMMVKPITHLGMNAGIPDGTSTIVHERSEYVRWVLISLAVFRNLEPPTKSIFSRISQPLISTDISELVRRSSSLEKGVNGGTLMVSSLSQSSTQPIDGESILYSSLRENSKLALFRSDISRQSSVRREVFYFLVPFSVYSLFVFFSFF